MCRSWYENGKKKYEDRYKNGQKHGVHRGWYETGEDKYEIRYKNGVLVI